MEQHGCMGITAHLGFRELEVWLNGSKKSSKWLARLLLPLPAPVTGVVNVSGT